ncbi:RDD family protein [Kitasatospora sp. NPDC097691]|uniref:RDD family protein n=1 Tax=Kitasatospora sp. NPDC097691 TaxID=3157231 RepID=UPI003332AC6F
MTDRSFADGGDLAVAPQPGYYPDPSIPGFVRYWGGSAWVPGTSRPAPAEGELLEPPRYAARRPAPGGPPARPVPPPVVPAAAVPAPAPTPVPERRPPAGGGDTGPVYFDQTSGGASFVIGSRVAEVIGGPVFRTVGPSSPAVGAGASAVSDVSSGEGGPAGVAGPAGGFEGSAADTTSGPGSGPGSSSGSLPGAEAAPGESGWQADPRAQRGLMETGGAARWVSWGVLPGAPEEEGRAEPECAAVAVEPAAAVAPARAVAVREAPAPSVGVLPVEVPLVDVPPVEASGALPVVAEAEVGDAAVEGAGPAASAVSATSAVSAASAVSAVSAVSAASARTGAPASVAPTAPLPAVRPARKAAARRRSAVPAAVPAGLGRRLAARAVDTVVLLVVAVAAGIPLGSSVSDHLRLKLDQARMASALTRRQVQVWLVDDVVLGKIAVLIGILLLAGLLYEVLPIARTGQTFGKRLARIRVVDAAAPARTRLSLGRSLLRWAVRQVGVVLLLGLVWPVFDRPARRGWQDRAARTRVVRA